MFMTKPSNEEGDSAPSDPANMTGVSLPLTAPVSGWLCGLAEIPDEAFAGGMLGPGVAIEPLAGEVRAPCDGVVAAAAEARHAVTIEAANGAHILIHIGVDTVSLGGAGFEMLVREGARVRRGDLLMRCDLNRIADGARSLAAPVILTNADEYEFTVCGVVDRAVSFEDEIFTVRRKAAHKNTAPAHADAWIAREVTLPMPHGLHARPAARIAEAAKAEPCNIRIRFNDKIANAKSATAIMGLGAKKNATLVIEANGAQAADALDRLSKLIETGAGDAIDADAGAGGFETSNAAQLKPVNRRHHDAGKQGVFTGACAAPGSVIGPLHHFKRKEIEFSETGAAPELEKQKLQQAVNRVLAALRSAAQDDDIARAHAAILDDPEITDAAFAVIESGKSAAFAWRKVMRDCAATISTLDDLRMAERAGDFRDLERRVLAVLCGDGGSVVAPAGAIVIADEFFPSEIAPLKASGAAGLAAAYGGATSHAAILAATTGLPSVTALGEDILSLAEGEHAVLDADNGVLQTGLDDDFVAGFRARMQRKEQLALSASERASEDCRTKDGVRIEVFANIGSVEDAQQAIAHGAEGCGLLRTEFLFLDRPAPPSEAEQAQVYGEIVNALGMRPLIIRTLDIGADKPARYLDLAKEENPALGMRGVRLSLLYPELLSTQLRAILRAHKNRPAAIMLPMVSSHAEIGAVRRALDELRVELGHEAQVSLGIMVETPAAALAAEQLAPHVDFMSIGSNDLAQYTLAMDRCNAALASESDAFHPSVLRLVEMTASACRRHDRWAGICGGLASNLLAAPVLIGLGVTELSATPRQIPLLKAVIRTLDRATCEAAAQAALEAVSAAEGRKQVKDIVPALRDWL